MQTQEQERGAYFKRESTKLLFCISISTDKRTRII